LENYKVMMEKNIINPALNLQFHDLYFHEGLEKLHQKFNENFAQNYDELYQKFCTLKTFSKKEQDAILIDAAIVLEDFIADIFLVKKENLELRNEHKNLQKISFVKREFVQRIIAKKFDKNASLLKYVDVKIQHFDIADFEKKFAEKICALFENEKNFNEEQKEEYDLLSKYAAWALFCEDGKQFHKDGALFKLPQKIDHQKLFDFEKKCDFSKNSRDGFNLTDKGFSLNQAVAESYYCIFCHNQDKDSCRTGIKEKLGREFKKDPLNLELHGCPLDQKISEMNFLKSEGFAIASLAVAAIDNPLLAGTGHRICNDCMKSCIFQKQDPVNIPQVETENLKDVLKLPYGFEIYSLLTRWNPLNFEQPFAKKNSGKKVLIAGLGPAGYTLAHYLLNDGHVVVAIDGLKIEPLNSAISGIDEIGNREKFLPIKFLDEIYEPLSSRLIQGFGGVAEYGITSRWDKNFLTVIRLLIERRENFRMFGGIRFGSSITDETAFDEYGFDHVALCIGAGRPNIIDLKNNYAKGVRSSSDFLMSLQLNGAFKEELFTNLQIRMPIAIIGAGLTAIDTACEAQEYYFSQIAKFSKRFNAIGKEKIWSKLNDEEKIIAQEFLDDAEILANCGKEKLFAKYGGAKILYRKKIQDSPAYRFNHQELEKAFEEGVEFIENACPTEIILDEFSHASAVKCVDGKIFAAKSILIAAGTSPNISPVTEDKLNFKLNGKYFEEIDENGEKIISGNSAKPSKFNILTKIDNQKRAVSFFGDLHPNFEGNVVKAMASAKFGHKQITEILKLTKSNDDGNFLQKINSEFLVTIKEIVRISDNVVEVVVKAPLLAKHTQIGQIFRLQNYHVFAKKINGQIMAMEGVSVTALNVDREHGLISGIVVETGGSSSLIRNFKSGEPAIFMGPSGTATEIAKNETVILIGGGRGNMPLTAIAQAYKNNGCKIIFFAGYRKNEYVVRQSAMENVSDILIYAIEEERPNIKFNNLQNLQYQGYVTDAIKNYFSKNSHKIDRIFTIGSDKMMAEISRIRHKNIISEFSQAPIAVTSLNAPMQCMMKGVCSQCLQKRINEKGEMEYFYSCASQDQNMDKLDFKHLRARCEQNSLQEKVTKSWIKNLLVSSYAISH